jgi:hypothetical protein
MITIAVLKLTRVSLQSVRKPPMSQIAVPRCHDYPLTSFTPEKGVLQKGVQPGHPLRKVLPNAHRQKDKKKIITEVGNISLRLLRKLHNTLKRAVKE